MSRLRLSLTALIACSALALAACGDDEDDASAATAQGDLKVVATTGFAADLVRGVAGDRAEVTQLVPDSSNPHSYSASAKDRATLEQADVVVGFGRNYEEGLALDDLEGTQFSISDHIGSVRRFAEGEIPDGEHGQDDEKAEDEHGHDDKADGEHADEDKAGAAEDEHADEDEHGHDDEHGVGSNDPHVWMDPTRMAAAAPALATALAKADPQGAATYRQRAGAYARRLMALDREIAQTLSAIPAERRKLVTSHESLGYFAARYDLDFVGAPFGVAPDAEVSASDVADIVKEVRTQRVPAVFAQQGDDPKVMRQIAKEAGVRVVDDLLIENPGPQGESYEAALRFDAERVAEALAP